MNAESTISDRQRTILELIKSTVRDRGYPPSVREIGEAVGLSSPSTVHSHLSTLVREGYLRRDPSKPRAIEVIETDTSTTASRGDVRDVPLLGRVAAGSPILATEDLEDTYALPASLVGQGPIFMLRIKGDSMINAGILDGDLVVVRSQPDANDGDIVAALIDGEEATIKRLSRSKGKVTLIAENESVHPMEFTDGVEVLGKVVTVMRTIA